MPPSVKKSNMGELRAPDVISRNLRSRLRGQLNASGSRSPWSLGDGNVIGQYLHQTETNVTVNWSGGGFVKPGEKHTWTASPNDKSSHD